MAKVRAPLHSMDLRGRMADGVVFGEWRGIPWMRVFVMPSQPETVRKVSLWRAFPKASKAWGGLTDAERQAWEAFARAARPMNQTLGRSGNWSGFDAYVSVNTILADAGQTLAALPPALPLPDSPERFRLRNPGPGVVRVRWEPLPTGTLIDLWLQQTKPSCRIYPTKFRHLVYADGTTGLHVLTGIPAGTRVAAKGRVIRPDGGRSHYAQAEMVV